MLQKSLSELMKSYSEIVSVNEGKRMSEQTLENAFGDICDYESELFRMHLDGWIAPESELLVVQAAKLLKQAVKISNSK